MHGAVIENIRRRNVIVDTDPGIDDCLAILFGLQSKTLAIKALTTTFGNASVEQTTKNLIGILDLCGIRRWPLIGKGAGTPLAGASRSSRAASVHGKDGLGNTFLSSDRKKVIVLDAVELIGDTIMRGDADTLIALGPLTNIAQVFEKFPVAVSRLRMLYVMAGVLRGPGTVGGYAESNAYRDPEALDAVLNSGVPVTLVSLDATRNVILREADIDRIAQSGSKRGRFLREIVEYYIRFYKRYRSLDGACMHDPACMGIAEDETIGSYEAVRVGVDRSALKRGRIFLKRTGRPNVRFCKKIDCNCFINRFLKRIERYL